LGVIVRRCPLPVAREARALLVLRRTRTGFPNGGMIASAIGLVVAINVFRARGAQAEGRD